MNTTVVYGLGIWAPLTLTGTTRPTNNRDSDSHSSVPSPATLHSFHELEFLLVFVFLQVPPPPIFTWYIPLFSLCLCTFVFCVLFVFAFTKAHSYFSFNSYIYCHLSLFWGFCIYTFLSEPSPTIAFPYPSLSHSVMLLRLGWCDPGFWRFRQPLQQSCNLSLPYLTKSYKIKMLKFGPNFGVL